MFKTHFLKQNVIVACFQIDAFLIKFTFNHSSFWRHLIFFNEREAFWCRAHATIKCSVANWITNIYSYAVFYVTIASHPRTIFKNVLIQTWKANLKMLKQSLHDNSFYHISFSHICMWYKRLQSLFFFQKHIFVVERLREVKE